MDTGDFMAVFNILRIFVKNNGEPMDFKDFVIETGYREDGALSLLDEMITKKFVKISGTRIVLSDIGNVVLPYLKEKISKKDTE